MNKVFSSVPGNHPGLNRFDCSYTNTFSANIGTLYVAGCDEVYPGDVFKMSAFCHCEVQPMVAPLMSDLTIYSHSFFVPYRILYGVDNVDGQSIWEKFITGGKDGTYATALPSWSPTWSSVGFSSKKIWDSIGNPVSLTTTSVGDTTTYTWTPIVPSTLSVSVAPRLAYNKIYNDFYRDENLQTEIASNNEDLLTVSFKKDYFTSALEMQQRGTSPAIPITGTMPITATGSASVEFNGGADFTGKSPNYPVKITGVGNRNLLNFSNQNDYENNVTATVDMSQVSWSGTATGVLSSVNINQLRLMFAQQRMLELAMLGGYRYTEWLGSMFGVNPTDARLDRPEYIGGCMIPVNISPSVQTSTTTSTAGETPQGNKIGIGNANAIQKIGNYRVLEHGIIMTLVSVRPKPIYQQGINRQWLRQTRYDYYNPCLANLSEMGVYNAEIYVDPSDGKDDDIFGYQAHWNELRCKNNIVTGSVREQFDYWTLARKFGSRPALNSDFIKIRDSEFNRCFAVQDEDEFIIAWSNIIDAYRPLPAIASPGLIDHVYGGR